MIIFAKIWSFPSKIGQKWPNSVILIKNSEVIPHLAVNKLRIIKIGNFLPRYDLVYRKLTKNDWISSFRPKIAKFNLLLQEMSEGLSWNKILDRNVILLVKNSKKYLSKYHHVNRKMAKKLETKMKLSLGISLRFLFLKMLKFTEI